MKPKTTVIGGGLAGLTAATLLARGGRAVTLYEKAPELGGRARTQSEHGALFNQGPHALYRSGRGMQVLSALGIEPKGRLPPSSGALAWHGGRLHALPVGAVSLLTSTLFNLPEKLEFGGLLSRLPGLRPAGTVGEWLARDIKHDTVRQAVRAVIRVSSYSNHDALPARLALDQLRLALKGNVLYLHGGWQQLVDAVRAKALEAGVRIVERQRVTSLDGEAETVLAVTPDAARELVPQLNTGRLVPVRAACLDLALARLPRPRQFFALGIDQPLYFSVHSRTAELGPHQVIQVAKYLGPDDRGQDAQRELEALTDAMQPGWREHVVARRFLPELTVVHALPGSRPAVDAVPRAHLCGDWVGEEGMLLDCALASAAEAARRILGTVAHAAAA